MRCDECGYDYDAPARDEIAARIRAFGPRYAGMLEGRTDDVLRSRPAPEVWSPLEYACHVRDVLRAQRDRVALSLRCDTPEYPSMNRDERATMERYNDQDPATVRAELAHAADDLARALEALDDAGWQRTGIYSYPTREVRSLEWVGRHTIHEGEHHLLDLAKQLATKEPT